MPVPLATANSFPSGLKETSPAFPFPNRACSTSCEMFAEEMTIDGRLDTGVGVAVRVVGRADKYCVGFINGVSKALGVFWFGVGDAVGVAPGRLRHARNKEKIVKRRMIPIPIPSLLKGSLDRGLS